LGFGVTVNTDNRLMSSTTLTKELSLLCHAFGYDLADLMNFQLNAAQAAFMSLEDKEVLLDRLVGAYEL
jgi:adenosine deaminase